MQTQPEAVIYDVTSNSVTIEFTPSYNVVLEAFNASSASVITIYKLYPNGRRTKVLWKL